LPKGFTKITLPEGLKDQLKSVADAEGLGMPDLIRKLLGDLESEKPIPEGTEEKGKGMSEAERILEKIDDAYAKFREERAESPTHFIMDLGAKQALKIYFNPLPADLPRADIASYLGIPIIDLEKVVIVDSQNLEAST